MLTERLSERNNKVSNQFLCRTAERIIPIYVRGGCSYSDKRFLRSHCAECSECAAKLLQEQERQAHMEGPSEPAEAFSRTPEKETSDRSWRTGFLVIAVFAVLSLAVALGGRRFVFFACDYLEELKHRPVRTGRWDEEISDYSGPVDLPKGEDHAIDIEDTDLEEYIRAATGIVSGDVMYSDVLSITRLELNGYYNGHVISLGDLRSLKEFKNLEKLTLRKCDIGSIKSLKRLEKLKYLDLSDNHIYKIKALRNMKKLRYLSLKNNQISDIGPLEGLSSLRELDLEQNNISDISPLAGLKRLKKLNLKKNRITDITALQDMDRLKFLDLSQNKIREVYVLKSLDKLEKIDIGVNPIEDESILSGLDAIANY